MAYILQPLRSLRCRWIRRQWCQVPGGGLWRWWQRRGDGRRRRPASKLRRGGGRTAGALLAWRGRRRLRSPRRLIWTTRRRDTRRSRCRMRRGPSGRSRRRRVRRGGRDVGLRARGRRAWSSRFHRRRGRPRRSGPRRRCGSCRRYNVGARRSRWPPCCGRRLRGRVPGRCRWRSPWRSSGRYWLRSRPRRRSGPLPGRRLLRGAFCRRLRLSLRMGFLPLLRLRHDQRSALGVRWQTCKLHRRQGGRGKQRKTKSGHLILSPRVKKRHGGINKYRLGRNVAAPAGEFRFISWVTGSAWNSVHQQFRRPSQGLLAKTRSRRRNVLLRVFPASE